MPLDHEFGTLTHRAADRQAQQAATLERGRDQREHTYGATMRAAQRGDMLDAKRASGEYEL